MQRIRKGDQVIVISGKNRGAAGIVLKILNKKDAAIVEGLNKVKKHQKGDDRGTKKSEIVEQEAPIKLCQLALIDTKEKKQAPTKVKYIIDSKTNKKIRVSRKTQNPLGGGK
ncbi:50S ribosomal protein L24 [Mycoplasmoides pirum]|uniref:50S ribosomal protein L24 n=1 Tax=Mycoplasmoides pirum TaxID=2122 RepID=UPI0004882654|nr:50S ribosomal protein L24 [Mycoplasmoides pirum]